MKAEQRKELETNTLADKMGLAMKRVKTSPRRSFFIYLFVTVALLIILFVGYRWWITSRLENSERWVQLYDASSSHLLQLSDKESTTQAGKAARFQIAWLLYWDEGIRMIGNDAGRSMNAMKLVGDLYRKLAEDCKDDPVYEPQALLGIAVVEETKAIQARSHLEKAAEYYENVTKKYKETAQGKFAQSRLDQFKDEKKRAEVASLYDDLQKMLRIPPPQAPQVNIPNFPPPPPLEKKDKEQTK